jgi:hypothetical protein
MQGEFWIINSKETLAHAHAELDRHWAIKPWFQMQIEPDQNRSGKQNSALQVYCGLVAKALNDSGQERRLKTPAGEAMVPWNKDSVREHYWRPLQIAITGEVSTTAATRKQYPEIYDVMNRHLGESKGIHLPWPVKKEDI